MRFIRCFVILAFLLSATLSSACQRPKCLPEPETDTTPPTVAGAVISYYVDGYAETMIVGANDPPVAIRVDEDSDIFVIYKGQDNEGMKSLRLAAEGVWYPSVGVIQRGVFGIDPITASCPLVHLVGETTFPGGPKAGEIFFNVISENWVGLKTYSNSITLSFGTIPQPIQIP